MTEKANPNKWWRIRQQSIVSDRAKGTYLDASNQLQQFDIGVGQVPNDGPSSFNLQQPQGQQDIF